MKPEKKAFSARRVALLGLLFALSMAFSFFESLLSPPGLPPGIKLGLSNLVTMYCLFLLDAKRAFGLATLKSAFVFLIRGPVGALLSFCGGVLSVAVMALADRLSRQHLSILALSVLGAVSHNIGQLIAAAFLLSQVLWYYVPLLLAAGLGMGLVTGYLYGVLDPYLRRMNSWM